MTDEQANECARTLGLLYPTLTPSQVKEWALAFRRWDRDEVIEAIREHHLAHQYLDNGRLTAAVRERERLRQWRSRPAAMRIAEEQAAAQQQAIDRFIGSLNDAQISELLNQAMVMMPSSSRNFFQKSDPRSSRILKAIIFEHAHNSSAA